MNQQAKPITWTQIYLCILFIYPGICADFTKKEYLVTGYQQGMVQLGHMLT